MIVTVIQRILVFLFVLKSSKKSKEVDYEIVWLNPIAWVFLFIMLVAFIVQGIVLGFIEFLIAIKEIKESNIQNEFEKEGILRK